ncbi:class I adenylate-forming enzyme family protein [Streptomyces sp. NPDC058486]|uniref:class I adenylate-forming enzyme family protein n=1 Tax=unclassified Streptomyces TaxID=2593676 RepID=UPI0036662FBD
MPNRPVCVDGSWVDDILLQGDGRDVVLHLDAPVTRAALRGLVAARRTELEGAGLTAGGSLAVRLPPSLSCIVTMLAGWRTGAQVILLDYRLTPHEVGQAIARLTPQLVVESTEQVGGGLRGFFHVDVRLTPLRGGRPAATEHALLQLSSGSTGPSKVIGRTVASLLEEIGRYGQLDGFPRRGERTVVLASIVHVLGLVGGLLYGLASGTQVVLPTSQTLDGILKAVQAGPEPTTILGVPSQAALLAAAQSPARPPQLRQMITGGELIKASVRERFTNGYGAGLGAMYGMTETGVIAVDLSGTAAGLTPVPGMRVRVDDEQILLGLPTSPYVGKIDPTRYVDGWLYTKDAGHYDETNGLLTVHGRLDSQVSVGGLKVDLSEVEASIASLPGITDAVVVHGTGIEAYVTVAEQSVTERLAESLATRLAPYKRPRAVHVLAELPRTATGKPVRNAQTLRSAARATAGAAPAEK